MKRLLCLLAYLWFVVTAMEPATPPAQCSKIKEVKQYLESELNEAIRANEVEIALTLLNLDLLRPLNHPDVPLELALQNDGIYIIHRLCQSRVTPIPEHLVLLVQERYQPGWEEQLKKEQEQVFNLRKLGNLAAYIHDQFSIALQNNDIAIIEGMLTCELLSDALRYRALLVEVSLPNRHAQIQFLSKVPAVLAKCTDCMAAELAVQNGYEGSIVLDLCCFYRYNKDFSQLLKTVCHYRRQALFCYLEKIYQPLPGRDSSLRSRDFKDLLYYVVRSDSLEIVQAFLGKDPNNVFIKGVPLMSMMRSLEVNHLTNAKLKASLRQFALLSFHRLDGWSSLDELKCVAPNLITWILAVEVLSILPFPNELRRLILGQIDQ